MAAGVYRSPGARPRKRALGAEERNHRMQRELNAIADMLGCPERSNAKALEARVREVSRELSELRHEVNTLRAREASKTRAQLVAERDEARAEVERLKVDLARAKRHSRGPVFR